MTNKRVHVVDGDGQDAPTVDAIHNENMQLETGALCKSCRKLQHSGCKDGSPQMKLKKYVNMANYLRESGGYEDKPDAS